MPAEAPVPSAFDFVGKAKHGAWAEASKRPEVLVSREGAQNEYVKLVVSLCN
jgi:acyl-CoA-binding protein